MHDRNDSHGFFREVLLSTGQQRYQQQNDNDVHDATSPKFELQQKQAQTNISERSRYINNYAAVLSAGVLVQGNLRDFDVEANDEYEEEPQKHLHVDWAPSKQ